MTAERPDNRIKVVDLVRTVSIIAVLANHFFSVDFAPGWSAPSLFEAGLRDAFHRFALSGAYGVSIFFVLSGFLITRMTAQRNTDLFQVDRRQFYIRRAGRILPLLLLVMLLVLTVNLLCSLTPDAHFNQELDFIFKPGMDKFSPTFVLCFCTLSLNWLYIFSTRQYGMQLAILWSIAVEEQFYFLLPQCLRTAGSAKKFVPGLLFLIALGPIARWLGNMAATDGYVPSFEIHSERST